MKMTKEPKQKRDAMPSQSREKKLKKKTEALII
jgi:hypothetical protein